MAVEFEKIYTSVEQIQFQRNSFSLYYIYFFEKIRNISIKNSTRKSQKKLSVLKQEAYNVDTLNSITYRSYKVP